MNFDRPSSTDSLANNTTGTTFAAKARMAELNAARASKAFAAERKEEPVRMEPIKLFKPRAKAKTWRPFDLSSLDGPPLVDEQDSIVRTVPATIDTESSWQANYVKHLADEAKALSDLGHDNFPKLGDTPTKAPGNERPGHAGDYDSTEWIPDLPNHLPIREDPKVPTTQSSSVTEEYLKASASAPLSHPRPLQASHCAAYGYRPNLESLLHNDLLDDVFEDHASAVPASAMLSNSSYFGHATSQIEDDPFAAQSLPNYYNYLASQQTRELIPSQPRRLGVHQYPAVKGTMNPNFQFPARPPLYNPMGHVPSMPTNSASYARPPPGLNLPSVAGTVNAHIANTLPEPYRRASADEKKAQLKQHLESLFDGPSTASRTVLHDPIAYVTPTKGTLERVTSEPVTTSPTAELVANSEALAWRDRPVTIFGNAQGNTVPTFAQMQPQLDRSLDQVREWFHTDNRVPKDNQKAIQSWLTKTRKEVSSPTHREEIAAHHIIDSTLVPVIANLAAYTDNPERDYFTKYGRAPDWCIDQTPSGNHSFFGKDWGVPPKRVGRDARYRPLLHEGRYSIFENLAGTQQMSAVGVGGFGAVGGDRYP